MYENKDVKGGKYFNTSFTGERISQTLKNKTQYSHRQTKNVVNVI